MNVAIPLWGHHVSTVFDFCNHLLVADVTFGQIRDRKTFSLEHDSVASKPARLKELGVDVLLCGAISGPLYRMLEASGITIIPFLRGTAEEILEAYLSGRLLDRRFMLPGCHFAGWNNRGKGMRHRCRSRGRENRKTGR